jgi:hypothetical protein
MSCATLQYLSCQLCRVTTLHDGNYCLDCRVYNQFAPSARVVETPKPRNTERPNNRRPSTLTQEQLAKLTRLRQAGLGWAEIGRQVGLSGNGAKCAWWRMSRAAA